MQRYAYLSLLVILLVSCSLSPTPAATEPAASSDAEARAVVENFGSLLQHVSLLAPDVAQQIQTVYAPFVSEELLAAWVADPATAPGRLTSSPWPDRIEIDTIQLQPDGSYLVTGTVIEITSAEIDTDNAAAQYPVQITVRQVEGEWLISAWLAGEYE